MKIAKVHVYLKGGVIIKYDITAKGNAILATKAREHGQAIMSTGIRYPDADGDFVWYGPHWIDKIKVTGVNVPSKYPTEVIGT